MSNLLISYHATSEAKGGCPFTSASSPQVPKGGRTICRSADPPYPGSTLRLGSPICEPASTQQEGKPGEWGLRRDRGKLPSLLR